MTIHPSPILADLAAQAWSAQTGLLPGNGDKIGHWLAPPDFVEELHREFSFTMDACPYPRPAGFDGLKEEWGDVTWVNPPFVGPGSSRTLWARKAIAENKKGKTVVMINSIDRWQHEIISAGAEMRPARDFKWLDTEGRPQRSGRANMLWILRGRKVA